MIGCLERHAENIMAFKRWLPSPALQDDTRTRAAPYVTQSRGQHCRAQALKFPGTHKKVRNSEMGLCRCTLMVSVRFGEGRRNKTSGGKKDQILTSPAGQKFAVGQEWMIIIFNIRKDSFQGQFSLYKSKCSSKCSSVI